MARTAKIGGRRGNLDMKKETLRNKINTLMKNMIFKRMYCHQLPNFNILILSLCIKQKKSIKTETGKSQISEGKKNQNINTETGKNKYILDDRIHY